MDPIKQQITELEQQRFDLNRKIEKLQATLDSKNGQEVLKAFLASATLYFVKGWMDFQIIDDDKHTLDKALQKYQRDNDGSQYHFSVPIDTNYNIKVDDSNIQLVNSYVDQETCNHTHTIHFLNSIGFPKEKIRFEKFEMAIEEERSILLESESVLREVKNTVTRIYK